MPLPLKRDIRQNKLTFQRFKEEWVKDARREYKVKTLKQLELKMGKKEWKRFNDFVDGRRNDHSKIWGFYDDYRTSNIGIKEYLKEISI